MTHRKIKTALVLLASLTAACAERPQSDETKLYVSIAPLQEIVRGIVSDDFEIGVLVPAGASPETYEPTPRQYMELSRAPLIFNVGLIDFEQALLQKLDRSDRIVNLSAGIDPIAGSCAHHHPGHAHAHGVDPHVWTSPRALQRMAANAYEAIRARYPDSTKYAANHERLQSRLRELDARTAEKIERSGVRYIVIYHPALTYYARDYGIEQAAIEADGKEPSARRLGETIRQARERGVRKILYQSQFPATTVETAARDIGAQPARIDPLRADAIANIDEITDLITSE